MDYTKHIKDLSWEIYLRNLNAQEIEPILKDLVELAKNAGKMELNVKYPDLKIDTINLFDN
jgi:hypothetical protein